jgi:hypothetical protein
MRSLHQKKTWSGAVLVINVLNLAQHLALPYPNISRAKDVEETFNE